MLNGTTLCIGVVAVALWAVETNGQSSAIPSVDASRVRAAGIRELTGKYLVLYTDLPSDPEVDALPAVFDQAVPQWAAYFGIHPAEVKDWQVRAFLIGDRAKFEAIGLMPEGQPFEHGFAMGSDLWVIEQPTPYYRRHLLLHEGTHAFMAEFLGGCGPGWYMEGTAELLATHRWGAGGREQGTGNEELVLNIMPASREEVPMLGRIKLVRDAVEEGRVPALPAVMQIKNRRQPGTEDYAWCWAAAKFFDAHPRYRERFRRLRRYVRDEKFNDLVQKEFGNDWQQLKKEWLAFVTTLGHGYDFDRMAIDFQRGKPLDGKRHVAIAADRGWQSSGVWLETGKTYKVTARGRYQIAAEPADVGQRLWMCEPGGVTIEYHDGRPLGMLLGAVVRVTSQHDSDESGFVKPIAIGTGCAITPDHAGTLYLRVNDSPACLADNRGTLTIEIED